MAESKNCEEAAATNFDIATKAVYEFTKSFLLSGKKGFINLDGNSGKMKYVDVFGNIIGGVVGLVVPGAGKPVAALSKKPFDYGDQKIQKSRRDIFLSILNSHSKYIEDEFQRIFIEVGVSVFFEYEPSLRKINCKVGKGDNAMENKRCAIQKLGKYAGSIFVENIIFSKSKELDALLETLLKKPTNDKQDFFLSLYHKVKKPKFYFYVTESAPNLNMALKQTMECKTKHVTATEVFLKNISELCENEEKTEAEEDYWYLNIGKSAVVEMTCTAISSDRQFIHLSTLLSAIQSAQADVKELTEIQKKIHFYTNQGTADVNESTLMDHEKNLTWDLNNNSMEIKRLSKIVDEIKDQSDSLEDLISRISKLKKLGKKRELLTKELEEIHQKIIELKRNNSKWDTFLCQNMLKSNKDDLERLLAEINDILSHLSHVLSSTFSEKLAKNEENLEKLHQSLELCSITKVTDNASLEDAGKGNQNITDDLTTIRQVLPEIKDALLALQMIKLNTDVTTISFERSLKTAEQGALKNQKEMEQLSVLMEESQTLEEIIFVGIQEVEGETDPQNNANIRDIENSLVFSMLQKKVEDYCKQAQQLIRVQGHLLRLAPSFRIKSNDFADRLEHLRTAIANHIQQQTLGDPSRKPVDASNALPTSIWCSEKILGFPPRERHAAVAVGKRIYSFGGINEKGHSTYVHNGPMDVFVLNVNEDKLEWKLLAIGNKQNPNPTQRRAHSVVAYNESAFIFGGYDNTKNNYSNSTWRFDAKTLQWNQPKVSGNIPKARSRHTATVYRNQMLVLGGKNNKMDLKLANDLHSLDLDTFHWSTIQTTGIPPPIRRRHSATVYKDKLMFIFGGNDTETNKCLNDFYCYNLNSQEWTRPKTSGTLPQTLQGHSAFTQNGLIFIFGGSTDGILWFNKYLNDLFCYNPETSEWKEVKPIGKAPSAHCNFGCVALDKRVFIFGGSCGAAMGDTFVLEMI